LPLPDARRDPVCDVVVGIFLNRKNLIVLLMAIELMLLAVNMNFVAFSHYLGDMPARSSCSSS
jgi:NADH:ubiquinone oxidoreductase subunit K